jgi:23S rRNA pseudouridine2605 synthase
VESRLNKYLAYHLGLSRREADDLIQSGQVRVDGEKAVLGSRVTDASQVLVRDKPVERRQNFSYILLHKPVGYVCSRRRQGDTPTIYELLPDELHNLKPVGRLDKDSSGLIILTDDGDFAHRMTHPSFQKTKVYLVKLHKALEPLHQQMITDHGLTLDDGVSKFEIMKQDDGSYQVTMREGRNRQIRRTFGSLGYMVKALHRTQFGAYSLGDLAAGKYITFEK